MFKKLILKLLKQIKLRCWPFWSLWFNLKFYLDSVSKIRVSHYQKCSELKRRSTKIQRKLYVILTILAIRCVQLVVLSLVELSIFARFLNFDLVLYFDCPKVINLSPMTFGMQALCFAYRMYWFDYHRAFEPILIVKRVLFGSWNGLFLERRIQHGERRVAIGQMVYSYTASYLNVLKYFYAFALGMTTLTNCYWARNLSKYWEYFLWDFPTGPLGLAYAFSGSFLAYFFIVAFTLVNITWTAIIFAFTLCMFIRLKQANKLLQNSTLSSYTFGIFCWFHTDTLTKIIAGNRYFGQMLLDFMFIYMPINIFLFTQLILSRFELMATFVCINVLAFHYITLFGFHLLAAMYSARIHKCRYWLLGWSSRAQFSRRLGTKLKLAHYICAFHTENRYGISYGEFGLISFESFTKVIASWGVTFPNPGKVLPYKMHYEELKHSFEMRKTPLKFTFFNLNYFCLFQFLFIYTQFVMFGYQMEFQK